MNIEKFKYHGYNNLWVDDQNGKETPVPIPNTEVKLPSDLDCTAFGWEIQDVANPFMVTFY